jgi:hypothetical protein
MCSYPDMDRESVKKRFETFAPFLDERTRRLYAAVEATALGYGGISAVSAATGISRRAITEGCQELKQGQGEQHLVTVRRKGGGRKPMIEKHPDLKDALEKLVEPVTRGDPESPLRWTCKSVRVLSRELKTQGYEASHNGVALLLNDMGYSLQANRKTQEGTSHPDRNSQFEYINARVMEFQATGYPVISIDTKKKELVGNFKNGGRELRPKGQAEPVRVHDFAIPELGKVAPYGIYDMTANVGWVNVGVDHDTAAFAVESVRRWWYSMGVEMYPQAPKLLITADSGGSNGYRIRLWKVELQKFASQTGLCLSVCHLPPGTSKWNKIEHRLFSYISQNWRGKPLISHEVIVDLIAATTTQTGLKIQCELDWNTYPKGIKVSDEEMKKVKIIRDPFHGEWNYTIVP